MPCVADNYKSFAEQQFKRHNTSVHVAIIIKRGKVLAVSANQIGSRGRCSGYGYAVSTLHAEKAVVRQLGDISQMRGASMIVVRLGKKNMSWTNSKPCHSCEKFLDKCMDEYGLRRVYYSS